MDNMSEINHLVHDVEADEEEIPMDTSETNEPSMAQPQAGLGIHDVARPGMNPFPRNGSPQTQSSIDDFMQSLTAQKAVEIGYHTDLIRLVVTEQFKETGQVFLPNWLVDSILVAQGRGDHQTSSVGEALGCHAVEVESESASATPSNIVDTCNLAGTRRMNSYPRTVALPVVTPYGSLQSQTPSNNELVQSPTQIPFDQTPNVGEASGGHDVDYHLELDSGNASATPSNIVDNLAGTRRMNSYPRTVALPVVTPYGSLQFQTPSIDDFMQSLTAQKAVEMGYHTDLIRYVVTQHFKKTGRQFSKPEELLDSIWEAQGQGIDPTPSVGKATGGHDVDYHLELDSGNASATPSNIVDNLAGTRRMNSYPRTVALPVVTPNGSLQSQTPSIDDFMQSSTAQLTVEMGYHTDLIRDVAIKHFQKTGREFSSSDELLESIWEAQAVSSGNSDPSYLDKQLCKICLDNELNTVFLPCKHLATCSECAPRVTECPMCRQPIGDSLTIYMS